jgi:hypothetical protein
MFEKPNVVNKRMLKIGRKKENRFDLFWRLFSDKILIKGIKMLGVWLYLLCIEQRDEKKAVRKIQNCLRD